MNNDTTLGIRITADSGVAVGEVKVTREELERLDKTQQKMSSGAGKLASQYSGMDKVFVSTQASIRGNTTEYKKLDDQLVSLLTRIDPLYARTRQLDASNDLLHRGLKAGLISQKQYDAALGKIATSFGEAAEGAEKSAFASAGARRELIVLGHEAMTGNFSRMPGSFMVLAKNIGSAGVASLLFRAAMIGGPIAAAALMTVAFSEGEKETQRFNNALQTTNNFAGQTRGTMLQMAQSISAGGDVTIGVAKDIVTQLVSSGQIGAQSIGAIAALASNFAAATGRDINEITPELIKLFGDPAKGAAELNKQMHFLSIADQEYIDHLVRIGQEEQARLVLAEKLGQHIPKHAENLGLLEKAWDGVKNAASGAWDAMLSIGREDTLEQKIKSLQGQLIMAAKGNNAIAAQSLAAQLAALQNQKAAADGVAAAEAKGADAAATKAKAYESVKKSQTYQIKVLQDELELVSKNAPDDKDKAQRLSEIRRQIRDMQAGLGKDPARQAIDGALTQYRNALADAAKAADKVIFDSQNQALDSQLKQNLISYDDYYKEKNALETSYYEKQAAALQQKISNEQAAAAQARGRGDTAGAIGKDTSVAKLQGDLAAIQQQQQAARQQNQQAAAAANDQIARQILGIQQQVLSASEQYGQAAVISAALQYGDLIKRLQAEGNTGGIALIQSLINVQFAKGQIQEIEASFDHLLTDLDAELKRIDIEKNAGILTEFEARRKIIDISQQQLDIKLRELAAEEQLRSTIDDPAAQQATDAKIQALQLQIAQLRGTVDETNRSFQYGAKSAIDDYFDSISNGANQARDLLTGGFKSAEDVMTNFFKTGKFNADDFVDYLQNAFARLAAQRLLKPFAEAASNGDFNEGIGGVLSSLFGSANGNAFTSSGVVPFRNGGVFGDGQILTKPTYFKFANGGSFGDGVAGEDGPEGAMPLKRMSNGKLGVYAEGGGGGSLTVNLIEAPGKGGQVRQQTDGNGNQILTILVESIKKEMARDIQRNGIVAQSMQSTFGLNRAAVNS